MFRDGGFIFAAALILLAGPAMADDQTARDKGEVETLIRGMFSRKIGGMERVLGKDALQFTKRCEYVRGIFEPRLIEENRGQCRPVWPEGFRFPTLSSEDLMYLDEASELPRHRIVNSRVEGATSVVVVQTPILEGRTPSRVVYYLKKTDGRWRISNLLSYDQWPLDTNQEGGCRYVSGHYSFALAPQTEADLEDLPPLCKALELDNMRRSGSIRAQQKTK